MYCKGVCSKYIVKKPSNKVGRYELGHKRCSICEVYIIWSETNCPCCRRTLRVKPRHPKARERLAQISR